MSSMSTCRNLFLSNVYSRKLKNEWKEKTNSNQKVDQKTPQNLISLENATLKKKVENDRFFVARATPFARGNSDGIQMVGLRWFEYCID